MTLTSAEFPAIVYDKEVFPNCTTLTAIDLWSDAEWYFEISDYRDDSVEFWRWLDYLRYNGFYMIGYNNVGYDYNLLHAFYSLPVQFKAPQFYEQSQNIIRSQDRFGVTVRPDERFIPQVDVYRIHHFDNQAKRTSLKALEVAMRSDNVRESKLPFNLPVTQADIINDVRPYNRHDVLETKKFALISLPMIEFRLKLRAQLSGDVLNFSDSKIGKELLIQRLGDVCWRYEGTRRVPNQTIRPSVALRDCIFPYIRFRQPEFQRIHNWLLSQVITETKGAFDDVSATINGFTFHFGTGGIHGSIDRRLIVADDEWTIQDDDVGAYYPSLAVANRLYPEHLGEAFVQEFGKLPAERSQFAKGTPENTALKLAGNSVFGDSGNPFSVFRDAKFLLSTTVNGQLLLCLYAEWLMEIPTVSLIQINTDGVTFRVHRSMLWKVEETRKAWQDFTLLKLETATYSRMWIRDVNNYVAETEGTGKLKLKGAYWTPTKFPDDIQNLSPTGWYRNYSADICAKAAVAAMTTGEDVATFIYAWTNPFDFMLREKADRGAMLYIGNEAQQKVTRYYVANVGAPMTKVFPPKYPQRVGQFKANRKVTDREYEEYHALIGNVWNEAIHTKNRSTYEPERVTNVNAGMNVAECNRASMFDFQNLNYGWYIAEARKLII